MISSVKKYVENALYASKSKHSDSNQENAQNLVSQPEFGPDWTPEERDAFLNDFRKAHSEWLRAQNLFDYAVEPELIDYMISMLDAAEKKYGYLLKQARKHGFHVDYP